MPRRRAKNAARNGSSSTARVVDSPLGFKGYLLTSVPSSPHKENEQNENRNQTSQPLLRSTLNIFKSCHLSNQRAEMIVMIVVAGIAKVRISASDVAETLAAGHPMPRHIVVQAQWSTVALGIGGCVKTLEAPGQGCHVQNVQCIWLECDMIGVHKSYSRLWEYRKCLTYSHP